VHVAVSSKRDIQLPPILLFFLSFYCLGLLLLGSMLYRYLCFARRRCCCTTTYFEHFSAACATDPRYGGSAILHSHRFFILHFSFCLTFYTISLCSHYFQNNYRHVLLKLIFKLFACQEISRRFLPLLSSTSYNGTLRMYYEKSKYCPRL